MEFQEQYNKALDRINSMYEKHLAEIDALVKTGKADESKAENLKQKLIELRDIAIEQLQGAIL